MKVLHIIPSVSPLRGGPSKAIIEMAQALIDIKMDVEIATTSDDGPGELDVTLNNLTEYNGVPTRFFKRASPPIVPLREFAFSSSFKRWLEQNITNYDVLHIHAIFSFTSSYAMWLARKRKVPYVVRPIGQLEAWSLQQSRIRKQVFLTLFERQNLLQASAIHFTADSEKHQSGQALPELTQHHCTEVIALGINIAKPIENAREALISRYDLSANKKIILFLSRLHPKKGLELLLQSLKQVNNDQWQLLIAGKGEGNYIESLNQEIQKLELTDHCQLIGFASGEQKQLLLQGADLYALTSHSENFGIAVLEALAAGTPALVSKEVALSKLISTQGLGYVCDLNQTSITRELQTAINGDSRLGEKAARYVAKHYQWSAIANSLQTLYRKISNDRTPAKGN